MKNQHRKVHLIVSSIVALTVGLITFSAQGQAAEPADWTELVNEEAAWTDILTGEEVPTAFEGLDLNALTKDEWKALCRDVEERVRDHDGEAWEDAVQQVIYLSVFHPDDARFGRANLPLFYDFTLGRDEDRRIMALAALHSIGDHNTMANVAQRVRVERSPRIKRLAAAAAVDYFSPKVDVGAPSPVEN